MHGISIFTTTHFFEIVLVYVYAEPHEKVTLHILKGTKIK